MQPPTEDPFKNYEQFSKLLVEYEQADTHLDKAPLPSVPSLSDTFSTSAEFLSTSSNNVRDPASFYTPGSSLRINPRENGSILLRSSTNFERMGITSQELREERAGRAKPVAYPFPRNYTGGSSTQGS